MLVADANVTSYALLWYTGHSKRKPCLLWHSYTAALMVA